MSRKTIIVLIGATLAAGCAQKPENIAAIPVAGEPYRSFSCASLKAESVKLSQDLANLSAAQQKTADGDVLGVILLGLPVSSMSGNDKEALIAVTKGRLQAVERRRSARNC